MIMALEPRIMFDGAAVADMAQDAAVDKGITIPDVPPAIEVRAADPAQNQGRKEVAFIDTGVADYQTLVDGVRAGVEVVLIDAGQSGLAQMAQWAETHSGYDAIHVLSHGSEGALRLGSDTITNASLSDAAISGGLAVLGGALTADGDLLVYGCSVASGEVGQAFISALATATGADVAASDDATGAAARGGDWELELAPETGIDSDTYLKVTDYTYTLSTPSTTTGFNLYGVTTDVVAATAGPISYTDYQGWDVSATLDASSSYKLTQVASSAALDALGNSSSGSLMLLRNSLGSWATWGVVV